MSEGDRLRELAANARESGTLIVKERVALYEIAAAIADVADAIKTAAENSRK